MRNKILDRKKSAREALLKNLASSLIIYEKIRTTEAKAKALQPFVEKLITISRKEKLQAIRRLKSFLPVENARKKIIEVLAERYKEKKGGYTRIVKIGTRKGDAAKMALIQLV